MTPEVRALLSAAKTSEWASDGLERLRARFAFSTNRSASCAVSTIEVERSKAELSQSAIDCGDVFGDSARYLVVSAAIANAINAILDDVHRTFRHAGSGGKTMRQSSESKLVAFQAEHESFVALLLQTFSEAAGGSSKGATLAAQIAACFKCGQYLTHSLCSILSALELDEDIQLGADRFFAHLSNLARMSIVSRELFSVPSSGGPSSGGAGPGKQATEAVMSRLGVM